MKLYWGSGSPVSWRVQLALALKQLHYDSHRLDLGAREHRQDAYRAINPKGTFPFLVDGEVQVRESIAILAYLERRYPEPPLFGASAEETARIWQAVMEHDKGLAADADIVTQALFRKDGLDKDPEAARSGVERCLAAFSELDGALATVPWLAGDAPSAVDVVTYPTVHRLLRAAGTARAAEVGLDGAALRDGHPALMAWLERLRELPGVDDTHPPHWRES